MSARLAASALCLSLLGGALPAAAFEVTVDLGAGAEYGPTWPGADEPELQPWIIARRAGDAAAGSGFSILPSLDLIGPRDSGDSPILAGLDDIDRAVELGARLSYGAGPLTVYGDLRQGLGGHEGVSAEIGARYSTRLTDRLSLTSGLSFDYGDADRNATYFGVPAAAATAGRPGYDIGSGWTAASASLGARYSLGERTAILGEVEIGRLLGDAADSPLTRDRDSASVRLGVVRSFSFGF